MRIEPVTHLNLGSIQTLVFAGGGNRCWWQAGAVTYWQERGWTLPPTLIGTSAGAAVATACLSQRVPMALNGCIGLFDTNPRIFDWRGLARLKLSFAHQRVYPAWLSSFIDDAGFDGLRQSPSRLRVAFTRPARLLGLGGSLAAGTLAYMVDRYLANRLHPRLPRWLGLHYEFIDLQQCDDLAAAKNLLVSAAAAPPFLSAQRIDGRHAIDGGYADNAPIPEQTATERSSTLVLLTRHYPKLPTLFRFNGRHYWQPSRRVPVSTWDCTARATVRDAFSLGQQDALGSRAYFALS